MKKDMLYLRKFRKDDDFYFMSYQKKSRKDGGYQMICGRCNGFFKKNPFRNGEMKIVKIPIPREEGKFYKILSHFNTKECQKKS